MDEPERLLDQKGSALARTLLREGRDYQGSDHLRAHTMAALGLAGSAGLALSISGWLAARSWTTKLFLALSTAGLLAAIPVTYMLLGDGASHAPAPATIVAPALVVPAPSSASSEPESPAASAAPAPAPSAPPTAPRARATGSSALGAELAALDAVRSKLAADDATGALASLGAYFRAFPRGRLHLEAEVLRIDTLAQAGRPDDARRYAEDFLLRHPNSVLTARIRPYAQR